MSNRMAPLSACECDNVQESNRITGVTMEKIDTDNEPGEHAMEARTMRREDTQ